MLETLRVNLAVVDDAIENGPSSASLDLTVVMTAEAEVLAMIRKATDGIPMTESAEADEAFGGWKMSTWSDSFVVSPQDPPESASLADDSAPHRRP
jgi:hypothetical protein